MCAEGRDSDVGEGTKDSKTTVACALCKTCVLTFVVPSGVIQLKRHLTVPTFSSLSVWDLYPYTVQREVLLKVGHMQKWTFQKNYF